jgi:hypothetical protein
LEVAHFLHSLKSADYLFKCPIQVDARRFSRIQRCKVAGVTPRSFAVTIPLESDIADVMRYFRIRKAWEDKQYLTVTDAELIFRNEARVRFKGEIFEALYRMLMPVQKGAILAGFTRSQGPEIRWPRKT